VAELVLCHPFFCLVVILAQMICGVRECPGAKALCIWSAFAELKPCAPSRKAKSEFSGSLEMRTSAAEAALQRQAHGTRERVPLSKTVICNLLSRALKQSLFFRNASQAGRGFVVELFEPEGEVELSRGEVAAGDEAEDGVLDLRGQLGEGVAGAGAGDGVELVEA
jgi:hypothetical protein